MPVLDLLYTLDFGRRDLQEPVLMRKRRPVTVSSQKNTLVDVEATAKGGDLKACFLNTHFLRECLYTLTRCQILIISSIFLRIGLFVHVLIFIKVFNFFVFLENCYFVSKYHFVQ